jgi:hypothetical protein
MTILPMEPPMPRGISAPILSGPCQKGERGLASAVLKGFELARGDILIVRTPT